MGHTGRFKPALVHTQQRPQDVEPSREIGDGRALPHRRKSLEATAAHAPQQKGLDLVALVMTHQKLVQPTFEACLGQRLVPLLAGPALQLAFGGKAVGVPIALQHLDRNVAAAQPPSNRPRLRGALFAEAVVNHEAAHLCNVCVSLGPGIREQRQRHAVSAARDSHTLEALKM